MTHPDPATETDVLIASLNEARRHLAGTCRGLTGEQLDQVVVPSGWTLRQRLEHMIVNERFWLQAIVGGNSELIAELEAEPDDTWQFDQSLSTEDLVEVYRAQWPLGDEALRRVAPGDPVAWFPIEQFGGWHVDTVRKVVQHLLIETATHAGHMDIVRELIDGAQWLVVD